MASLFTPWDRRLYFPSQRRLRIFSPLKIWWFRLGLNPRTWVLKATTLPLDYRSYYNDMFNTILCLITSFIKHSMVLYISIEQLCKCDFEFVTLCIYKYHNKMHQEDKNMVLNTILPSKRSFLIDFWHWVFPMKTFTYFSFLLCKALDAIYLIFLDLTTAIMRDKQKYRTSHKILHYTVLLYFP